MHEFFLKTFARSFLKCVVGEDVTQDLIAVFTTVVRRVDFEHVSVGDILMPLQSLPLRELTPPNTPLACLLEEPSDHNLQALQEAVMKCEIPITRLELSGGKAGKDEGKKRAGGEILHIYLSRSEIMQRTFSKLVQVGVDYGSTTIMNQINMAISCPDLGEDIIAEEHSETSSEVGKTQQAENKNRLEAGNTSQVRSSMETNMMRHRKKSVETLRILALAIHLLRLVHFHRGRVCLQAEVEAKVKEMRRQAEEQKMKEEEDRRAKEERQRKFKQWCQKIKEKENSEERRRVDERKKRMTRRINRAFAKWKNEDWEDVEVEVVEGTEVEGVEKVEWEGKDAEKLMKETKKGKTKRKHAVPRRIPYLSPSLSTRQPTHRANIDSSVYSDRKWEQDSMTGGRASSIPLILDSLNSKQTHSSKSENLQQTKLQDDQDSSILRKPDSQSDSQIIGTALSSEVQFSEVPKLSNSDDFGTHQMWPEPTMSLSYRPGDAPWAQSDLATGREVTDAPYMQASELMKSEEQCILAGQSLVEYLGAKERKGDEKQDEGGTQNERNFEKDVMTDDKNVILSGRDKENLAKRRNEQKLGNKRRKTKINISKLNKDVFRYNKAQVKTKKKNAKCNVQKREMKKRRTQDIHDEESEEMAEESVPCLGLGSLDGAEYTPDYDFQFKMKSRQPDTVGDDTDKLQLSVNSSSYTVLGDEKKKDQRREDLLTDSIMHDSLSLVESESVSSRNHAQETVEDSHAVGDTCEGGSEWVTVSHSCVTSGDSVTQEREAADSKEYCEGIRPMPHVSSKELLSGVVRDRRGSFAAMNEGRGYIKKISFIKNEKKLRKRKLMKQKHQEKEEMHKECESSCTGNRKHEAREKNICLKIVSENRHKKESSEDGERKSDTDDDGRCIMEEQNCQCAGIVDMKTNKPWDATTHDFHSLVLGEVQRSSEGRHGEDKEEVAWRRFLEQQATNCVTLQLLSVSHQAPVKVDLGNHTHNSKEWAFVLYNYSRLCGIFETFDYFVTQGELPPLPPPHQLDFALLRRDEEWALVWAYVLRWPEVAESVGMGLLQWVTGGGKGPTTANFKTGAITRFLSRLAHSMSRYYARHQVLPSDPSLVHLHPLTHARLHLMHAIRTVMKTALGLLGVDSPPTFM